MTATEVRLDPEPAGAQSTRLRCIRENDWEVKKRRGLPAGGFAWAATPEADSALRPSSPRFGAEIADVWRGGFFRARRWEHTAVLTVEEHENSSVL